MRKTEPIQVEQVGHDRQRLTHPCFALVSVSEISGRSTVFGSEIVHDRVLRVTVQQATQERNLSNDWNFGNGTILSFDMTHAQFAQFISSHSGRSTPATLRMVRTGPLEQVSEIDRERLPLKVEQFRQEMQAMVRKVQSQSNEGFQKLDAALQEANISQKLRAQLMKLAAEAQGGLAHLPSGLGFILEQAHEAADGVVNEAKLSLEAYALRRMQEAMSAEAEQSPSAPSIEIASLQLSGKDDAQG